MGQATVDLPDPMKPPVSAAGTDELLAQLAGEEIDRLLAEADAEHAAAPLPRDPSAAPPVTPQPSVAVSPRVQEQATAAAAVADAELSAQLDNLFADLTANPATAPPAPEAVAASAIAPTAPATVASTEVEPVHPVEEELRATEALERAGRATAKAEEQAQAKPAAEPSAAPPVADAALAMLAAEESPALPLYLRPLEWLSAPLDALPEGVRDVMGKVAILTTVNALAVLVYVFLFRRH